METKRTGDQIRRVERVDRRCEVEGGGDSGCTARCTRRRTTATGANEIAGMAATFAAMVGTASSSLMHVAGPQQATVDEIVSRVL